MSKPIFRAYLRTFDGVVPPDSKTITHTPEAALAAFRDLLSREDLVGQAWAAVLSRNNRQVAYHRFDREPGHVDYWADRLDAIPWPQPGRPPELSGGGRNITLYLNEESVETARALGEGNVSEGVRRALAQAQTTILDRS